MTSLASRHSSAEQGQATVELVALLPLVAVVAGLLWQAVVAGQAVWCAGAAARAAARASAVGGDARAAARHAVPGALRRGLVVRREHDDEGVRVAIAIPAVIGGVRLGTASARARLRDQTR
ncbi:MAG: hypothetical protein QOJ35_3708 [Solirubrobacteraceae bacterium]|jgi:hypothetical protein|nr:hypothetical protein [Solirubrobacteraceae bacterium]